MLFDRLVGHARVVAEPARRHALPLLERVAPACVQPGKSSSRTPSASASSEEDVEVGPRLARRRDRAIDLADAPLGVGVGAFLLAPDRRRQHQVRELGGRRRVIAVLHDQELEPFERLLQRAEVRERDDRVGGDDPERADASFERRFDDVGIREAARRRNALDRRRSRAAPAPARSSALSNLR